MDRKQAEVPGISRREFLTYAWVGSIGLLMAEGAALMLRYGMPYSQKNIFGGIFVLNNYSPAIDIPVDYPEGQFWLAYSPPYGIVALYKICPFERLTQKYKWIEANMRFECPNCGSKFDLDGRYIEGPAPRALDRFPIKIFTSEGTFETNESGDPIQVDPEAIERIEVDTSRIIRGQIQRKNPYAY